MCERCRSLLVLSALAAVSLPATLPADDVNATRLLGRTAALARELSQDTNPDVTDADVARIKALVSGLSADELEAGARNAMDLARATRPLGRMLAGALQWRAEQGDEAAQRALGSLAHTQATRLGEMMMDLMSGQDAAVVAMGPGVMGAGGNGEAVEFKH